MDSFPFNSQEQKPSFTARVRLAVHAFSATDKVIFFALASIFVISALTLASIVNQYFSVEVPIRGGTLVEGVVGSPYRYINPLIAITDSGRDLTQLIYSGLMRPTAQGTIVPDLAETYTISEDGKVYTVTLKDTVTFHDGVPVTADDIIFTIEKTQDPTIQSPKRANFAGIEVQKIDTKTVQFILPKAYAPFIENLTLGILPKHIWKNVSSEQFAYSQYNERPIGSGPYKFSRVQYDANSGLPQWYELVAFDDYALQVPYISKIIIRFYATETAMLSAFNRGDIDSMYDISPQEVAKISRTAVHVEVADLPRVFGIFFNQNQAPVLANKEVSQALKRALDKESIVDTVLYGYATVIDDPIPPGSLPTTLTRATTTPASIGEARKILTTAGWVPNEEGIMSKKTTDGTQLLQFSISTPDAPELVQTATLVQQMWQELGARVDLKIFETGELNQNVIRPRRYDALLFGEIIGRDLDLYAFWHSSQRTDPGLNITGYVNLKVDKILETARSLSDSAQQISEYQKFETEVRTDIPAIFVYSPQFIYVVSDSINGISLGSVTVPAERFANVSGWYIETDSVWKIFAQNNN